MTGPVAPGPCARAPRGRRTRCREGAGTLTAVTLLFVTILAILGTAASTMTSSTAVAVARASRRGLALRTARAAVCEAMAVFDTVVQGDELPSDEGPEERLQYLLETMGPVVGFVDPTGERLVMPPPPGDAEVGDGRVPASAWYRAFRDAPATFRGVYRSRWALRGLSTEDGTVDLGPVDLRVIHHEDLRGGPGTAGTLSFRARCSVTVAGGAPVVRRYELRRRFSLPAGPRARVRFVPAPLGIFVDGPRIGGEDE